jgi:hypothetical protein
MPGVCSFIFGKTLTEWGSIALSKDTWPNRAPECVGAHCSQSHRALDRQEWGVGGGRGVGSGIYVKAGGVGRLKAQSGRVVHRHAQGEGGRGGWLENNQAYRS